jgi:hypothetical protein
MQNLGTLRQLSLGDLADDGRREERGEREEEKIMPSLMATLLRWHTHSARTNFQKLPTVMIKGSQGAQQKPLALVGE